MEEKYFIYDDKIPLDQKKIIVSSKKIPWCVLEKMVMDIRKNKPKGVDGNQTVNSK